MSHQKPVCVGVCVCVYQFGQWKEPGEFFFTKGPLKSASQGPFTASFKCPHSTHVVLVLVHLAISLYLSPLSPGQKQRENRRIFHCASVKICFLCLCFFFISFLLTKEIKRMFLSIHLCFYQGAAETETRLRSKVFSLGNDIWEPNSCPVSIITHISSWQWTLCHHTLISTDVSICNFGFVLNPLAMSTLPSYFSSPTILSFQIFCFYQMFQILQSLHVLQTSE